MSTPPRKRYSLKYRISSPRRRRRLRKRFRHSSIRLVPALAPGDVVVYVLGWAIILFKRSAPTRFVSITRFRVGAVIAELTENRSLLPRPLPQESWVDRHRTLTKRAS